MNQYRCIALDLDGTLLNEQGKLTVYARETLEAAIAAGIHVVVASGRAYDTLPASVLEIPGIEYAITSNGAAVYRVSDSSCLCVHKLQKETVQQILEIAEKELKTPVFEAFVDGIAYGAADYVKHPERYEADSRAVAYIRATRKPCEDFEAFLEEHLEHLDSLDLVISDPDAKRRLWERLEREVSHVYITASVPRLLEISDEKSGKAQALAYVLDRLGVSKTETAAFGNADNDADMLEFAGCGVAVANATEKCLRTASRVTESNEEDGAAKEIRRLLGI